MLFALALCLTAVPQPLEGVADHPLVSRYAGSVLQNAAFDHFTLVRFPTGPLTVEASAYVVSKGVEVEGTLSARHYISPPERSALEVFRNYEQALGRAGFSKLFACAPDACVTARINEGYRSVLLEPLRWAPLRISPAGGSSPRELHYWSGKMSRAGKEAFVQVWVMGADSVWEATSSLVVVVEPRPMETEQVVVSPDALGRGLELEGKVALTGLFFDTGKAELKPESKPQLEAMAALLSQQPTLQAFIVGHTDNVGAFEANLSLSQRRAEAVVAALVKQHQVSPARLTARGVANLSPLAENRSEAGRARNRRVELVAR
jgi:OmpA-OmpF porin, OOP family